MTKDRPVVTNFKVRPVTYPDGHWMNRFWGPLAHGFLSVVLKIPIYRHVLRPHREVRDLLDSGAPAIFACTHQDIFDCYNGLPRLLKDRTLSAMVSYSRDGNLSSIALRMLGYEIVRGSSSRGGGEGLMLLRANLASGNSVLMACDGPKAPLGDVKAGVVRLASSAGVPIVPIHAQGLGRWRFHHSWTKASLSMPFGAVVIRAGRPLEVPQELSDPRAYQIELARRIAECARWASVWAHGPDLAPFTVAKA